MPIDRMVMLAAVVGWAIVSFANRFWGAVLGVVLALGVGVWGWHTMAGGAQVSFLGLQRPLSPPMFFTLVSMLILVNALTAVQSWRQRRRRPSSDAGAH
ncbi:MAG: hypothetical protein AB2A00_18735 [Myxococcota bacterium]